MKRSGLVSGLEQNASKNASGESMSTSMKGAEAEVSREPSPSRMPRVVFAAEFEPSVLETQLV